MPTRRQALALTALGLAALPLLPRRGWAQHSLDLGGWRLDTLSDGHLTLPASFAFGDLPEDMVRETIARHDLPEGGLTPPCNVTLLRNGGRTVLIDAGAGPDFMASTGRLIEALDALGLAPEDITDLVITHGHPDHLWGIIDDFDEPTFPEAAIRMGRAEHAYWSDPATAETIGEDRASFFAGASRRLALLPEITLFDDGDEILPGVTARLTPGHTPGHMAFELAGERPVLIAGDSIGNHHLAFDRPDQPLPSDQDPATAARTRTALLRELAEREAVLVGFHLPGGGIGRVQPRADGFAFVP